MIIVSSNDRKIAKAHRTARSRRRPGKWMFDDGKTVTVGRTF